MALETLQHYRPLMEGDVIRLRHGAQMVECKIVETEPPRRCIMPQRELEVLEEPLERADGEEAELGYEDIGGWQGAGKDT